MSLAALIPEGVDLLVRGAREDGEAGRRVDTSALLAVLDAADAQHPPARGAPSRL